MLAEATTTIEILKEKNPETLGDSKMIANKGGSIAGNTRKEIEKETGKSVVTYLNTKTFLENKKQMEIENTDEAEDIDEQKIYHYQ